MNETTIFRIAFAFGLRPDGSPGLCNKAIAQALWQDLQTAASPSAVGLQWEIYDALLDGQMPPDNIHTDAVVPPPSFTTADIPDLGRFYKYLYTAIYPAAQQLATHIPQFPSKQTLVSHLNHLLTDRFFFRPFESLLDLSDFHRLDKGLIGLEKRVFPIVSQYPNGLRPFQTRRVNRLLIEAIIPEEILKRGRYLNTQAVAERCLTSGRARKSEQLIVYAHPAHHQWCAQNIDLAMQTLKHKPAVCFAAVADIWDPQTAQLWCRSPENWAAYSQSL